MIVFCGKQETLGYVPQYKESPCSSNFKNTFGWAACSYCSQTWDGLLSLLVKELGPLLFFRASVLIQFQGEFAF